MSNTNGGVMVGLAGLLRKLVGGAVLAGSAAASYVAVSSWVINRRPMTPVAKTDSTPRANPFASANGTHLIAFVIAASDCGWSNRLSTMRTIGGIRDALRSRYGNAYARVSVVGVALDENLDDGRRFLTAIGQGRFQGAFDQVVLGGSWLNEEIVRFVWREHLTPAATPQIVVLERPVSTTSYLTTSTIGVEGDRLVVNPVGSAAILQWVTEGLPLHHPPPLADSATGSAGR